MLLNFRAASGVIFPEELPFMHHQRMAVLAISCVLICLRICADIKPKKAQSKPMLRLPPAMPALRREPRRSRNGPTRDHTERRL